MDKINETKKYFKLFSKKVLSDINAEKIDVGMAYDVMLYWQEVVCNMMSEHYAKSERIKNK